MRQCSDAQCESVLQAEELAAVLQRFQLRGSHINLIPWNAVDDAQVDQSARSNHVNGLELKCKWTCRFNVVKTLQSRISNLMMCTSTHFKTPISFQSLCPVNMLFCDCCLNFKVMLKSVHVITPGVKHSNM